MQNPDFQQSLPDQGSYKVWVLLLRGNFHSCTHVWDWVLKRNFQHNMSCFLLPEQVSGSTFLWGASPLSLNLVLLNLRYWWKTLTFIKICLTKTLQFWPCSFTASSFGASSIPANGCGIDFWKELSKATPPRIGHQSNFLPRPFTREPYHFPLIWYFWIPGISWKPLTFLKIRCP